MASSSCQQELSRSLSSNPSWGSLFKEFLCDFQKAQQPQCGDTEDTESSSLLRREQDCLPESRAHGMNQLLSALLQERRWPAARAADMPSMSSPSSSLHVQAGAGGERSPPAATDHRHLAGVGVGQPSSSLELVSSHHRRRHLAAHAASPSSAMGVHRSAHTSCSSSSSSLSSKGVKRRRHGAAAHQPFGSSSALLHRSSATGESPVAGSPDNVHHPAARPLSHTATTGSPHKRLKTSHPHPPPHLSRRARTHARHVQRTNHDRIAPVVIDVGGDDSPLSSSLSSVASNMSRRLSPASSSTMEAAATPTTAYAAVSPSVIEVSPLASSSFPSRRRRHRSPGGLGPGDAIPVRSRSRSPTTLSDADVLDDTSGLVNYEVGDVIYERYKIKSLAGQGTFGTVLHAHDMRRKEDVAIKVVRCVRRYLDAAYVEIDILDNLRKSDKDGNSLCVRMRKSFVCHVRRKRHVCLVFEPLGRSLYDFLKRNDFQGFSINHVREFSYQILQGISFCHRMKLIHTDLKLENVLLCNDEYSMAQRGGSQRPYREPIDSRIRIIDFGGATYNDQHHARMINTRQYRAPEVILGLGWSYASDLWSIGCMVSELFTGELLFGTHEDPEHLALMERVLETRIPTSMTKKAISRCVGDASGSGAAAKKRHRKKRTGGRSSSLTPADHLFSHTTGRLRWPEIASTEESRQHVADVKILSEIFSQYHDLHDLLRRLLCYDPDKRITAEEALHHPFFAPMHRDHSLSPARRSVERTSSLAAGVAAPQPPPRPVAVPPPRVVAAAAPSLSSPMVSPPSSLVELHPSSNALTSTGAMGLPQTLVSPSILPEASLLVNPPFPSSGVDQQRIVRGIVTHRSRRSTRQHPDSSLSSGEYAHTPLSNRNIAQSGDSYVRSPQGHAPHRLDVMRSSPPMPEPPLVVRTCVDNVSNSRSGLLRSVVPTTSSSPSMVSRPRLMARASHHQQQLDGQSGGSDFSDFASDANDALTAATMLTNLSSPRSRHVAATQESFSDRLRYISAGRRSLNDHSASLAERATNVDAVVDGMRARAHLQDMSRYTRQTFAQRHTAPVGSTLSLASLSMSPTLAPTAAAMSHSAVLRATAAAVAQQQSAAAMLRLQQHHHHHHQQQAAAAAAAAAALRSTLACLSRDAHYAASVAPPSDAAHAAAYRSSALHQAASNAAAVSVSVGVNSHGLSPHFLSRPLLRATVSQADLMLRGEWPPAHGAPLI